VPMVCVCLYNVVETRGPRNNAAAWDKRIRKDVQEDATKLPVRALGQYVGRRRATLAPS